MLRTRGPTRIDEAIMEKLLNVVDDPLFESSPINSEQADPRDRFVDGRFIIAPDRLDNVTHQKPAYAIRLDGGNRALLFPIPSGRLAGRAIRDTVANQDVAPAEDLTAQEAEAAPVCACEEVTALGAPTRSVTRPHGIIPRTRAARSTSRWSQSMNTAVLDEIGIGRP